MTNELSRIRKGIQKQLRSPKSLFWKFDSQDRHGSPFRVFLDLEYQGRVVVVEWCSMRPDQYDVALITEDSDFDESLTDIERTISAVTRLLDPNAPDSAITP